ncbi:hypothetical protein OJAV_G00066540 [Oryzias javanicus]|uniref:L1 transposable element RRM domain-containing protein n=1 Tax=Oryzias javanicus TaxID=123683 RepID=A0A3S2UGT3_ORYJA|nr:hypothetical protein OJAV_G00066540 [Oryzias javanicus]
MPKTAKTGQETTEKSKQPKLTEFRLRGETQKANASSAQMAETCAEGSSKVDEILSIVTSMKADFSTRLNKLLTAVEDIKKELSDCAERVTVAEVRISNTEDDISALRAKVSAMEAKGKALEEKVLDLESRSRRNNLRLVNLPEGAEGQDPCLFLEKWLPEALGTEKLQTPLIIERAHRIGPRNDGNAPPRTLIMRFLNYKDKLAVVSAARVQKEVRYKEQRVRLYPDLAAGVHQLQKQLDTVREDLRKLGIKHGVIHPAKLLVTYEGKTHAFKTSAEAREFLKKIQKNSK